MEDKKIEYKFVYKCRLCGEVFESGITRNMELAVKDIALIASEKMTAKYPHDCNLHDIGLADFIGIKGYEVKEI